MEQEPNVGAGPETTGNQEEERRERLREDGPRIYVASLSDYNAGILHGAWIAADQEPEQLHDEVAAMLSVSPTGNAEEFAIHDFEGFGQYEVDEYDSLERVSQVARGIVEHGPAYAAWMAHRDDIGSDETTDFESAYLGDWSSLEAYAEDLLDDLGCLRDLEEATPEMLRPYVRVDFDGFAHDLELSGDLHLVEHAIGVWIFEGSW